MSHTIPRSFSRKAGLTISVIGALIILPGCVTVKNFSPESGVPGTKVTIDGSGFKPDPANNTVKFADVAVPTSDVLSATSTKLKVLVPSGAKTGLISVSNSRGTGRSKKNFSLPSKTKWTLMIYLDADNNLEGAGIDDFLEMATVGSTAQFNVVVQMDRVPGHTNSYGDWTGTRRFLIQAGDVPSAIPVQDLGEQNMGDPAVLQDYVEWGVTNYPAEKYALVIWNHGGGWRDAMDAKKEKVRAARARGESQPELVRAVAWDDTDGDSLFMKEVQTALEAAKSNLQDRFGTAIKLDIVAFDACLMEMVEVAYALRGVASYVVGSEELEPWDGWPYDLILQALNLNPTMTPKDLSGVIVSEYADSYSGYTRITLSAVDIDALSEVVAKINAFTSEANTEWAMLKAQRLASRQYPSSWGVDLRNFADNVYGAASSSDIKSAALDLRNAIDGFVIAEEHSTDMSGSYGVAVYFPPTLAEFNADPDHTGYEQSNTFMPVDFVRFTNWDNWLQDYYSNIP